MLLTPLYNNTDTLLRQLVFGSGHLISMYVGLDMKTDSLLSCYDYTF